jgi:hypothetical protein
MSRAVIPAGVERQDRHDLVILEGRCAMGVKGVDGFQAPGLTFFPFGLLCDGRLPIRGKDQAGTCVGRF